MTITLILLTLTLIQTSTALTRKSTKTTTSLPPHQHVHKQIITRHRYLKVDYIHLRVDQLLTIQPLLKSTNYHPLRSQRPRLRQRQPKRNKQPRHKQQRPRRAQSNHKQPKRHKPYSHQP